MLEEQYVCPRCGKSNWKEVAKAGGMIGFDQKCLSCSFEGAFFVSSKAKSFKPRRMKKALSKMKIECEPWVILLAVSLIFLAIMALRFKMYSGLGIPMEVMYEYLFP